MAPISGITAKPTKSSFRQVHCIAYSFAFLSRTSYTVHNEVGIYATLKIHNEKAASTRGCVNPTAMSLGSRLCELWPGQKMYRNLQSELIADAS